VSSYGLAERPLRCADDDRLGVARHAHKLADMLEDVELPFTIGIYGPWGAGKTSFANFLVDDLKKLKPWENLRWLEFSAWPYTTADAIWRALLEELAAKIFNCERLKQDETEVDEAWRARLRKLALAEALTLEPELRDPARDKYDRLVARLQRAGPVANRSPDQGAAFTELMLEVATTVAPAVGPLRRLFAGPANGDAAGAANGEGLPARRSVEDLRDDLRDLFDHDPGARIVVLLDDLDRCQPQVALDVLETIKIFLFESAGNRDETTGRQGAQCLFLVAADERLVAQGLRARFGSDVPDEEARAYLEKIVQLGVDLPAVESSGAYTLVAEWAPEWAAAADLIVAGLDGNPRRMKQQCTLLSYRFWALEQDTTPDEETHEQLLRRALHKLARLRAVCPEAIEHVLDPAVDLEAHEAMGPEPADEDPEGPLAELLRAQPRARVLFTAAPSVAGIPRITLEVLAAAPDIRPGPDGMPTSDDRVFMYIARAVTEQYGNTSIERLNSDYLHAVLRLVDTIPEIVPILRTLSRQHDRYMEAVSQFDDWLDGDPAGDEDVDLASSGAQRLVELCGQRLAEERRAGSGEPLRTALIQSPRLSEIPVEHVRTVQGKHVADAREDQKTNQTSSWSFALLMMATKMLKNGSRRRVLDGAIDARLEVAKDIVERRKFVKLQLLRSRWPEFAELGRSQSASKRCQDIEKVVLRNDPDVQLTEADRTLSEDDTLRALLSIRPFFDQMFLGDVAALTATPEQRPTTAETVTVSAPPSRPQERYASLELELELSLSDPSKTAVTLTHENERRSGEVPLAITDIQQQLARVAELYKEGGTGPLTRDVRAPTVSADDALNDLGSVLWSTTIGLLPDVRALFEAVLGREPRVRLVIKTTASRLTPIPWECLYVPAERVFAGLALKLSVVRSVADTAPPAPVRSARPLRVLAVPSSPAEAPLPGAEQEVEILRQALEPIDSSIVRLEVVETATHDAVQRALRTFSPHVFHFVGHGAVRDGTGYLALIDSRGRMAEIGAREMGIMLRDHGILLAVLNGCATGSTETEDFAGGVGQTLVSQGVPAVVATTRVIMDHTALRFAGEFYRALTDGFSAESAIVEGRKALAVRGWDWSAYVTYTGPGVRLEELRTAEIRASTAQSAFV
jgi:KAP family P-loop domain/CHAT domain